MKPHAPARKPHYRGNILPSEWPTILSRIDQGETFRQIALDYHISETSIRRIEKEARKSINASERPKHRREKVPTSEWPTILQRHEDGETLRAIADTYGITYETLRRIVRKARQEQKEGE